MSSNSPIIERSSVQQSEGGFILLVKDPSAPSVIQSKEAWIQWTKVVIISILWLLGLRQFYYVLRISKHETA